MSDLRGKNVGHTVSRILHLLITSTELLQRLDRIEVHLIGSAFAVAVFFKHFLEFRI